MTSLSENLAEQKRWSELRKITMQVLERKKEIFGPKHPETLASINILAFFYTQQGLFRKAEKEW